MQMIALEASDWEYLPEPCPWPGGRWSVIANAYLADGTRIHLVKGHVEPGTMSRNAHIIGEDDLAL